MGTAHRVTPNPNATVLCHGLDSSEKQRFFKLATAGTHCLYLETTSSLIKFNKAQPPTCHCLFHSLAGVGNLNVASQAAGLSAGWTARQPLLGSREPRRGGKGSRLTGTRWDAYEAFSGLREHLTPELTLLQAGLALHSGTAARTAPAGAARGSGERPGPRLPAGSASSNNRHQPGPPPHPLPSQDLDGPTGSRAQAYAPQEDSWRSGGRFQQVVTDMPSARHDPRAPPRGRRPPARADAGRPRTSERGGAPRP